MYNSKKKTEPTQESLTSIYYRPLRKKVLVTCDFKADWERMTCAHRKAAQRNGQCCCPRKKWWLCDAICDDCEFCVPTNDLSLDAKMGNSKDDTTSWYDIIPAETPAEQNHNDARRTLKILLDDLFKTDKLGYDILRLYDVGWPERACADALGLSRYKYVRLRDGLINKYRDEFKK